MVERPVYGLGKDFVNGLREAAEKISEVSQGKNTISKQEIKDLISKLKHVNASFEPGFWEAKSLIPEEMNKSIEKALNAIQLFQRHQPEENKLAQKNVEQAVISLFSTLSETVKDLDKNLKKNLKEEYKIGKRVEKTSKSKKY